MNALPTDLVERWPKNHEAGLDACKRCGQPIVFAEQVEDVVSGYARMEISRKRSKWVVLDPDGMPHGCGGQRAGRLFSPSLQRGFSDAKLIAMKRELEAAA
jgi:hypothetical protein